MSRNIALALAALALIAAASTADEMELDGRGERMDAVWRNWKMLHEKIVSIEFNQTPLGDAVAMLAKLGPASIVITAEGRIHAAVHAKGSKTDAAPLPVTLKLENVPFPKALDALARAAGFAVEIDPPVFYLTVPGDRKIGALEIDADGVKLSIELTKQDVPVHVRREIVEKTLRYIEETGRENRRKLIPRIDPEALENLLPEVRERVRKALEKLEPRERMEGKRGQGDREKREKPAPPPQDDVF